MSRVTVGITYTLPDQVHFILHGVKCTSFCLKSGTVHLFLYHVRCTSSCIVFDRSPCNIHCVSNKVLLKNKAASDPTLFYTHTAFVTVLQREPLLLVSPAGDLEGDALLQKPSLAQVASR